MKKYLLLLVLFVSMPSFSQSINDYQYVIVPIKYDFLKENDKFRLNTLTKLLLQKYNFKSYLSTESLPEGIGNNRCSILYASLVEDNGLLVTKVKVVLKDCQDKVVYETDFGTSREKEYAPAYNQALRDAFQSFDKLKYKYTEKSDATTEATPVVSQVENTTQQSNEKPTSITTSISGGIFYFAQPIANGFQIVNNEPKVIMRLFNTSQKSVYIGIKGNINGVVISKNGQWFFEYYENAKLVSEAINLKF